jgi:hypothetical protein
MTITKASLSSELAARLHGSVDDPVYLSERVLEAFADFTPKKVDASALGRIGYINALDPRSGGVTVKPGNIRLNWRKLFEKTPELVLTGAGVTQPWLIPFAALYAWNLVWSLSKIEITQAQAVTMHALWNATHRSQTFSEADALEIVNRYRESIRLQPQSASEFARVIDDLTSLECIELEDGEIWLREWIKQSN